MTSTIESHIGKLLRTAIQSSIFTLPLTQPPTKQVPVDMVQGTRDCERTDTTEDCMPNGQTSIFK